MLRAVAHPLRLQILSLLTGTQLSAAEVARELDTSQANASYHLRVLASAGLLVPAGEERIRGGTAKRYRHPWGGADGPEWPAASLPSDQVDHQLLIQAIAQEMARRSALRSPGKFQFTDAELWVAPDRWEQCTDLVEQASTLLHSAANPPRTPGTIRVNMSAALFPMTHQGDHDESSPRSDHSPMSPEDLDVRRSAAGSEGVRSPTT